MSGKVNVTLSLKELISEDLNKKAGYKPAFFIFICRKKRNRYLTILTDLITTFSNGRS